MISIIKVKENKNTFPFPLIFKIKLSINHEYFHFIYEKGSLTSLMIITFLSIHLNQLK